MKENMMLAELVRLTESPEYASAHEAGWLNSQFHGEFTGKGHSSYQIYVWARENTHAWLLDESRFPTWRRIGTILDAIDRSGRNGVGGMVCHYGCVP